MQLQSTKPKQVDLYEGSGSNDALYDHGQNGAKLAEGTRSAIALLAEAYARKGYVVYNATFEKYISGTLDQLLAGE